jgi:hypothetical protein
MTLKPMFQKSALAALFGVAIGAATPEVTVFKTKTCGCCAKWVEHMRSNGFKAIVNDVPSTAEYRHKYGVPAKLQSCHTAVVSGYTFEGHVPASDIQRFLKEKPKSNVLAVPGMPAGSPGMEGDRRDAYSVLRFEKDGGVSIYRTYSGESR